MGREVTYSLIKLDQKSDIFNPYYTEGGGVYP